MADKTPDKAGEQGDVSPSATASAADDAEPAVELSPPPQHDLLELERLRSRLVRKFHGRK